MLILEYTPMSNVDWLLKRLQDDDVIKIRKTFNIKKQDLSDQINLDELSQNSLYEYESISFIIAYLIDGYYKFDRDILGIDYDLHITKELKLKEEYFIAKSGISIFSKIGNLLSSNFEVIKIGNNEDDTFAIEYFKSMIKNFPNKTELEHYYNARLDVIIKEFVETKKDSEAVYVKYMNNKPSIQGDNIFDYFQNYEKDKYIKILEKLKFMLNNESSYDEKHWQKEILQIIRLIFPKYIKAFENVSIKDTKLSKTKYLDFMLIDANGNIDIAEIKKPFSDKNIVSLNQYRNNYIPLRELSGSIMQIEKYIYNLTRWGEDGETVLTKVYSKDLPTGFKIKITNPNGLIIMGREDKLMEMQKNDFELIKRKYKNIIDILTYDDLIRRITAIIQSY